MEGMEMAGMSKSPDITNHLMVYIKGADGKEVSGKIGFIITGPDGKDFKTMTMGMYGGYGADVLDIEPPPADHPLLAAPNCVITPHIGSRTYESVPRQAMKSLTNLIHAIQGEGECNCANGVM